MFEQIFLIPSLGYELVVSMLMGQSGGNRRPLAKAIRDKINRMKAEDKSQAAKTQHYILQIEKSRNVITSNILMANSELLVRYTEDGNLQELTFHDTRKTQIAHPGSIQCTAILEYDKGNGTWNLEITTNTLLYENTGNLRGLVSEGVTISQKVVIKTDKGKEYELVPRQRSSDEATLKEECSTEFCWRAESSRAVMGPDGNIIGPVFEGTVPKGEIPVEVTVTNGYVVQHTNGPLVDFWPDSFSFTIFNKMGE